jgi:hypothetical protein
LRPTRYPPKSSAFNTSRFRGDPDHANTQPISIADSLNRDDSFASKKLLLADAATPLKNGFDAPLGTQNHVWDFGADNLNGRDFLET